MKNYKNKIQIVITAVLLIYAGSLYAQMDLPSAVQSGDSFDIQKVLDRGVDVNQKFTKGNTALMYAAIKGNMNIVKFLIDKGAKVNIQNDTGYTSR